MHLIADILSFNNNQEELTEHFNKTSIDWDAIVIIGSKHLMLPALYCNLKTKDLLQLIPEELQIYLEEITAINRGRNEILLKEANEISNIFKIQIELKQANPRISKVFQVSLRNFLPAPARSISMG